MAELVSLKEAAAIMGMETRHFDKQKKEWVLHPERSGNRLWELLHAGKLEDFPAEKIGRGWRVHKAKLHEWINRRFAA